MRLTFTDISTLVRCHLGLINGGQVAVLGDSLARLENMELVTYTCGVFRASARGKVYLDYIAETPLPVSSWAMPDRDDLEE